MDFSSIFRFFLTAFTLTLMVLCWIIAWLLQIIFMTVTYPFLSQEKREDCCGYIFRFFNLCALDLLNPLWKIKVLRPFRKPKAKKVVLMINHLSSADPFILVRVFFPEDATWIAKDELFRIPFGGWCMSNAGDMRVCFKNKREGFETIKGTVGVMMEQARKKLCRGRIIAVFPEGIRSKNPDGGLLPFRLGFFTLALQESASIIPVAISGSDKCWPLNSLMLDKGTAYISCGDPIDASQFKTAEELRDHVWQEVTKLRETHPDRQKPTKQ